MKEIKLIDIAKIQHWYIEIFSEEDSDYPNYKRIGQFNRHITRVLNSITKDKEEQRKIYDIIVHQSWNMKDRTFKPICDDLRMLGYTIIQGVSENQIYYQKHREQRIAYQKKYAKEHRDIVLKNNRNYKEKHKEKIKEQRKDYYKRNKERLLQKDKEYREKRKQKLYDNPELLEKEGE